MMDFVFREVTAAQVKSEICNDVLRALPSWFGLEFAIVNYTQEVREMPFYAAFDGEKPVGFVAIKDHNEFTAEIWVMGIYTEYHRHGIGRELIRWCEDYCTTTGREFLTVKTLDESRASKSYEKTRLFYLGVGFRPLEVFPLHWDKDNPCLFMAKYLCG